MARRAIVLGIDGLVLPLVEHLIKEDRLPHMRRLFTEGAVTSLLPFVSTWGPINWFSFATGAAPGLAWQGQPEAGRQGSARNERRSALGGEPLWGTMARAGHTTVVVSYPGGWPPLDTPGVFMIPDLAATGMEPIELGRPMRWMTPGLASKYQQPPGTRAGWIPLSSRGRPSRPEPVLDQLSPARGWTHLPDGDLVATSLALCSVRGERLCTSHIVLQMSRGICQRGWVCREPDLHTAMAELSLGAWSAWVELGAPGAVGGTTRFKLLEVAQDGREMAICHAQVYPRHGFAHPREVEDALFDAIGPYAGDSSAQLRPSDPFWQVGIEEAQYEGRWLAASARHLAASEDWRLWMTVYRPPDAANHGCLAFLDPQAAPGQAGQTETAMEILARTYAAADEMLGELMALAGKDTVVALASDHGAVVNRVTCDVYNLLERHGLLALTEEDGRLAIDWGHTQAYVRPSRTASELYVNLCGREPHGIVEPADYERVQRRIIDLLLDWREPQTGGRAVALALGKRDAALLGYWGEVAGDVQFIYNEGFVWGELPAGETIARTVIPSVNHGPQVPTAGRGLASNMGLLALWGPGIKRGYRRPESVIGPARMCDPAPTLAHLLGIDAPLHNQGAVLLDMLAR